MLSHTHTHTHTHTVLSHSAVSDSGGLGTVAWLAPLSMEFFRQEYWSGVPFPTPGDFPDLGIEPESFPSPALTGRFFTTSATWEAPYTHICVYILSVYIYIYFPFLINSGRKLEEISKLLILCHNIKIKSY